MTGGFLVQAPKNSRGRAPLQNSDRLSKLIKKSAGNDEKLACFPFLINTVRVSGACWRKPQTERTAPWSRLLRVRDPEKPTSLVHMFWDQMTFRGKAVQGFHPSTQFRASPYSSFSLSSQFVYFGVMMLTLESGPIRWAVSSFRWREESTVASGEQSCSLIGSPAYAPLTF